MRMNFSDSIHTQEGVGTMGAEQVAPPGDDAFAGLRFVEAFARPPVPHVAANTLFFDAGPLVIGVEYRVLSEDILAQVYGAERAERIMADRFGSPAVSSPDASFEGGVSIHVFDAATRVEHLRFDDLDSTKHYHYLRADGCHAIVWFDDVANGDLVTWALSALRERVGPMLELAGAGALAVRVDHEALERALPEVEAAARAKAVEQSA